MFSKCRGFSINIDSGSINIDSGNFDIGCLVYFWGDYI